MAKLIIILLLLAVNIHISDGESYEYPNTGLELYEINDTHFLPIIYSPSYILAYRTSEDMISGLSEINLSSRNIGFIVLSQNNILNINMSDYKNPTIYFQKEFDSKYNINITNINKSFWIFFNSRYYSAWRIFPGSNIDCLVISKHRDLNIYECNKEKKTIELLDTLFIFKSSLFKNAHYMTNGYANGWYVDIDSYDFLRYAHKNIDGTYDLNIILWFMPQSYFDLGIIISVCSIFVCVIYIVKNRIRRDESK